jgi:hypothetical protein
VRVGGAGALGMGMMGICALGGAWHLALFATAQDAEDQARSVYILY